MSEPDRCPGPLSRREFLCVGSLALGGIGLGGIAPWRVRASDGWGTASAKALDTSVILLWLPGGPPHMETYDMKPAAPAEYRGAFRPIKTNVPGIDVCELLPLHAKIAHRFSLIRSIHHNFADHGGGHKKFLTSRDPLSPVDFVNDYPMVGSFVSKLRPPRRKGIPGYVAGTDPGRDGIDVFSFGSAYLGPTTHPFTVPGDPSAPTFTVPNLTPRTSEAGRLEGRAGLLERLDRVPGRRDPSLAGMDTLRRRSFELLLGDEARNAFDLSRESAKLRERYGMHAWGQRALLARRLVEHGANFVTMVLENPYQSGVPWLKDGTYNWDSHAVYCHIFNDTKARLPIFDRTVTALIDDLYDRGLDRKVLLIVTGEFGRTPKITYHEGRPGRDHWPRAMSVLVSCGGLKMGKVVGSTNARGEDPKDRPLAPDDLWATMFRHVGIDPEMTFADRLGRPVPILSGGEPIAELI
jgi:hypothetical protein